jgi:hemerythrin
MLPAELVTGNNLVDAQHANLLAEVELLRGVCHDPDVLPPRVGVVMEFVEFLRGHFHRHFYAEEQAMAESGYPDLWMHRDEHLRFYDKFVWHKARMERGPTVETVDAFVEDVERWVRDHILMSDVQMAKWIRDARPVATAEMS